MKKLMVLVVMLAGCANTQFERPGTPVEQASRDYGECAHDAQVAFAMLPTNIFSDMERTNKHVTECMQKRGYAVAK